MHVCARVCALGANILNRQLGSGSSGMLQRDVAAGWRSEVGQCEGSLLRLYPEQIIKGPRLPDNSESQQM